MHLTTTATPRRDPLGFERRQPCDVTFAGEVTSVPALVRGETTRPETRAGR